MKNYLKTVSLAALASIFLYAPVMPMSGIFNYFMPAKKVEKFTAEDWIKIDKTYIEKKLSGPVDEAAYFVQQAHYSGCFSAFKYVTSEDIIRITLAHNECAVPFLKNCDEQCFKDIHKKNTLDVIQKLKTICAEAVTSKNLVAVSKNLFCLINQENDARVARTIITHINDDNIVKIPKLLLHHLIKNDPWSATTIAKAITPKNITYFLQDFRAQNWSIIFLLTLTDGACVTIIAQNAITNDNFNENIELVEYLLKLDPSLIKIFSKLKAFGQYAQQKKKEREEKKDKQYYEYFKNYSNGSNGNNAPAPNTTTMSKADAYRILGLPETALPKDITQKYRKLAREYHPDVNTHKKEPERKEAAKKMVALNEAYELLTRRSRL